MSRRWPPLFGEAGAQEPEAPAPDRFRRTLLWVGALHALVIGGLLYFSLHRVAEPPQIVWMDTGAAGESGGKEEAAAATPEPPEVAPEEPPPPAPPEPPEPIAPPEPERAPAELVVPRATPAPATPRPTPTATPKATPRATPKATPKATPVATPKATPRATSKPATGTPKPAATPKSPGSPKPAATPKKGAGESGAAGESEAGTAATKGSGKAEGSTGSGKGSGKSGNGKGSSGTSEYGWYFGMIKDRFYSTWLQPTSIVRSSQKFSTRLKIQIARDGRILGREIVGPSGNSVMDESVLTAAQKVTQIDALPQGLGSGESFEISIDFKLDQGE